MLKNFLVIIFCPIIFYSCDTDCNDCGPYHTGDYFIKNKIQSEVKLIFIDSLIRDTMSIPAYDEVKLVTFAGYNLSFSDFLTNENLDYDSCYFFIEDTLFNIYTRYHFINTTPPELDFLDVSDYIETKEEKCVDKFGKKNDVYCSEQEFLINTQNLLKMK